MQIENLRPADITELRQSLEEMRTRAVDPNPSLKATVFPQEDLKFSKRLSALEDKVDFIISKLNNIFGDSVLINGRFQDLKKPL